MYSQNNEDQIISQYFQSIGIGFKGTVLEIGANDGITLSNSRYLIEKGWNGALVEPAPIAFKKLQALYNDVPRVFLYNKAICEKPGTAVLYDMGDHLGRGDTSLLSTLRAEEKLRWSGVSFQETEVDTVDFETFLNDCPFKIFNYVSIDAEGYDLDIMKQIDFNKIGCRCICVEFNGQRQPEFNSIANKQGFRFYHKNAENLIYVR